MLPGYAQKTDDGNSWEALGIVCFLNIMKLVNMLNGNISTKVNN